MPTGAVRSRSKALGPAPLSTEIRPLHTFPMSEPVTHSQNIRASSRRLWATPLADGSIPFVRMQQLWEMAAGLPIRKVRVRDLNALDEVRWFSERMNKLPTCRAVAEHARNIYEVDFRFPL